jgi:nitroreductase
MGILREIEDRKSYRSFSDKAVSIEQIELLFEAARIAPSSSNGQAWSYYYAIKGSNQFENLCQCLSPSNLVWAKNASILVLSTAAKLYPNGKVYKHAWHDVGLANAQLLIQAVHLGLICHVMGGFSAEQSADVVQMPESHEPVCMIAIGYLGDGTNLTEDLRQRENLPRNRKSLEEVAIQLN